VFLHRKLAIGIERTLSSYYLGVTLSSMSHTTRLAHLSNSLWVPTLGIRSILKSQAIAPRVSRFLGVQGKPLFTITTINSVRRSETTPPQNLQALIQMQGFRHHQLPTTLNSVAVLCPSPHLQGKVRPKWADSSCLGQP
jgi:hypothetical protein